VVFKHRKVVASGLPLNDLKNKIDELID